MKLGYCIKLFTIQIFCLFILSHLINAKDSNCNKGESKKFLYDAFREAISNKLLSEIHQCHQTTFCLEIEEVRHHALIALKIKTKSLESEEFNIWKCGQGEKLSNMLNTYITYASDALKFDSGFSEYVAVDTFLRNLFRESGAEIETDQAIMDQLTGYELLLGYNWVDTDNNNLVGHETVGLSLRTRLKDWRVPHRTIKLYNIGTIPEGKFLDMLVDVKFVTNSPFYESTDGAIANSGVTSKSSKSANFSLGLYFVPWKYRFTDYGSLGLFTKIHVSSIDEDDGVFRRIIYGLRLEGRSPSPYVTSQNIEIGLTVNSVPGSFKRDRIIGAERIFIGIDIPYRSIKFATLFCRFKTEWNITSGDNLPIYEFQLGAIFRSP